MTKRSTDAEVKGRLAELNDNDLDDLSRGKPVFRGSKRVQRLALELIYERKEQKAKDWVDWRKARQS